MASRASGSVVVHPRTTSSAAAPRARCAAFRPERGTLVPPL